ncbi:MAG: hypothetical protein MUF49_16165 [Oculatellaceae cyanobacterium Prado106]|jgi:hypothetical protein|nr:hypothetical protein [Oculatellaceae cyanobacterium Prado106]
MKGEVIQAYLGAIAVQPQGISGSLEAIALKNSWIQSKDSKKLGQRPINGKKIDLES